ncbi:MAG TPA: anti-sigma factor antagonist [Actinomycetota bacterium]|jgi:anti-anti-sigma factor|nr:anti-sigma factor antagonist [Actinomycetota bacterium]
MSQVHVTGHGRRFDWIVDQDTSVLTVGLEGEIDLAAVEEFEPTLESFMEHAPAYVVLDMARVTFIDSTGLRLLLRLKRRVEDKALGSLLLGVVSPAVQRLLEITGLTEVFTYVDGHPPDTFRCPLCEFRVSASARICPNCDGAL